MKDDRITDAMIGVEMSLMSQEDVVNEFRELVARDLGSAVLRYLEFAKKLDLAATDGNAQVRSLIGGPDSQARAELVDIMSAGYSTASDEVKQSILDLAIAPLTRDNIYYVQLAVARMENPYLIGDIIREYSLYNPGSDMYEADLLDGENMQSPGHMQAWLDRLSGSFFSATSLALQRDHSADVTIVIDINRELFDGAAHIVAAHHDTVADRNVTKHPELDKKTLLEKYRSSFVDEFQTMIRQKTEEANWLQAK